MELKGVKNIIFDLGGVIINLDQPATVYAFRKLYDNRYPELEQEINRTGLLDKLETNEVSVGDFYAFFQSFNASITIEQLTAAWNKMLLDIPEERIFLIRKLARKYRVFLLSNTNQIHLDYINVYVKNTFGFNDMAYPFEKAYYSHRMGLRKPDPEIFKTVLKDKKLRPEETLFIDDSEQHILSANALNLKTHHLTDSQNIVTLFDEY